MATHRIHKSCCFLLAIIFCQNLNATSHTDNWNSAIITGPISKDKKFKYYIQPGLTFEDDHYKYRSSYLYLGVGYQTSPHVMMWLMNAWHNRVKASGKVLNIETIREQIDWNLIDDPSLNLTSISRFEQRKDTSQPQWLIRGREKLTLRIPFSSWPTHSFVTFDELYVNFNNPAWINNNSFFDINNIFVGVGTQLSPTVSFDLGYLNQYLLRTTGNKDNNVIYLMFFVALP
ncbi:MAG: DUF2490 domain-containing protein [Pseudomonadota bacterium]